MQMMMCDLKGEGYIAGMFFGDEFPNIPIVILEIKYSEEIEKLMKSTVKSFWSRKVDDKYITPTMLKTHMTDLLKKSIDKTYKSVL